MHTIRTACIIVLYNPDHELLASVLFALSTQTDQIIAVDNSTESRDYTQFPGNLTYIPLGTNKGIAYAQNRGIEYVLRHTDCKFILFMDQDSIAPPDMTRQLYMAYHMLEAQGIPVGGIAAQAVNRQNNKPYAQSVINRRIGADHISEVREIMNSASFIAIARFSQVGLMDESLFIDDVDWEWCWRAKAKNGLRFFICSSALLNHCLGQGDKHLAGQDIAISSPFRIYYQYRNYLLLCRRNYVPAQWKLKQGIKYLIKTLYYPLFVAPRKQYLRQIFRGIKDGLHIAKNTTNAA